MDDDRSVLQRTVDAEVGFPFHAGASCPHRTSDPAKYNMADTPSPYLRLAIQPALVAVTVPVFYSSPRSIILPGDQKHTGCRLINLFAADPPHMPFQEDLELPIAS